MLYDLEISNLVDKDNEELLQNENWLLREVLGYEQHEADEFISHIHWGLAEMLKDGMLTTYSKKVAINLTAEQVCKIVPPFLAYNVNIYACKAGIREIVFLKDIENYPMGPEVKKSHYYDEPVVGREHLVDVYVKTTVPQTPDPIARESRKPVITCPYCQSTDTRKISGLSKAGGIALFGIFAIGKTGKQWHCNKCKSDF